MVTAPFDISDAGRMAVFADPEGAVFCVWQANHHKGAGIINEHGSLNFNGLNTRDVAGAKAFYGAVFDWQTLAIGDAEMWTLPAYGDYLARERPTLREEMAAMGVPGFADVVASLHPIPAEEAATPAHWNVTFAVDDADAAAAKASELGGTVIAAPFAAPFVRMTVIADPQGATFIASQFVPDAGEAGAEDQVSASAA